MPRYGDDDELMAEITAAIEEVATVPPEAFVAARAAFRLRTVDQELELLTMLYDSSLEDEPLVRDASYISARNLTFQAGDLSLEVEMSGDSVIGQVVPPQLARIALVTVHGEFASADTDELGTFLLPRPAAGPVRLTCRTAVSSLLTDWISV